MLFLSDGTISSSFSFEEKTKYYLFGYFPNIIPERIFKYIGHCYLQRVSYTQKCGQKIFGIYKVVTSNN